MTHSPKDRFDRGVATGTPVTPDTLGPFQVMATAPAKTELAEGLIKTPVSGPKRKARRPHAAEDDGDSRRRQSQVQDGEAEVEPRQMQCQVEA